LEEKRSPSETVAVLAKSLIFIMARFYLSLNKGCCSIDYIKPFKGKRHYLPLKKGVVKIVLYQALTTP
jgi:hypothetical protein